MTETQVLFWLIVTLAGLLVLWLICDWMAWK